MYEVDFNVLNLILLSCKKNNFVGLFFPHNRPRYPHRNSTAPAAASAVVAAASRDEGEEDASIRLILVFSF